MYYVYTHLSINALTTLNRNQLTNKNYLAKEKLEVQVGEKGWWGSVNILQYMYAQIYKWDSLYTSRSRASQ